jgi:transcription factor SPN1
MATTSVSPPSGSPPEGNNEDIEPPKSANNFADDLSDNDSELSDVDEAQFEDFDASALALDRQEPVIMDEETVKQLGRHKRKRAEGEAPAADVDAGKKKKKKEGRREKQRQKTRPKKAIEEEPGDGDFVAQEEGMVRKSTLKKRDATETPKKKAPVVENEEDLDPEERMLKSKQVWARLTLSGRRRALDRAMDAALRKPNAGRRRKHGDIVRHSLTFPQPY